MLWIGHKIHYELYFFKKSCWGKIDDRNFNQRSRHLHLVYSSNLSEGALSWLLQGLPTHIDVFQTNTFSWFNDTVIKSGTTGLDNKISMSASSFCTMATVVCKIVHKSLLNDNFSEGRNKEGRVATPPSFSIFDSMISSLASKGQDFKLKKRPSISLHEVAEKRAFKN